MIESSHGLVGSMVSHYRVESLLGEGGMGVVYKAHDTVLGRALALKVLPPNLVGDRDRLARFVQEAKSASALNHPHVITIYEIGQAGEGAAAVHYIAMELVDGATLRERWEAGRLDLKKTLETVAQVADGLGSAHAAGIIHRDLKPENIMITSSGYAKILDFGLAKLREGMTPAGETSVTAIRKTDPGVVMGTAGYMSPEQAAGRSVDHRSDLFSLGCILYEALTGRRPFAGASTVDTLHKILHSEPVPIRDLQQEFPLDLQRIVRKCLAKDPDERYQSARDLAIDLREVRREIDSQPHRSEPAGPATRRAFRKWILATVLVLAVVITAFLLSRRKPETGSPTPVETMKISRITNSGLVISAVISPDAKYIAYVHSDAGEQGLWLKQLANGSTLELVPARRQGYYGLRFSPDGNSIDYVIKGSHDPGGTLYRISTIGGAPKRILSRIDSPAVFSPDGKRLAFVRADFPRDGMSALLVAPSDGSQESTVLTKTAPEYLVPIFFNAPAWSPDGKVIVAALRIGSDEARLIAVDLASRKESVISQGPWKHFGEVAWRSDGQGMYVIASRNGSSGDAQLWSFSYPEGKAHQITNDLFSYRMVTLSADEKSLVTVASDTKSDIWVSSLDGKGSARKITRGNNEGLQALTSAADGTIVFNSVESGGEGDLWVTDHTGTTPRQITSNDGPNTEAVITPDGRTIVWVGIRSGDWTLMRMNRDGSDVRELSALRPARSPSVTPDGKWVVFTGGVAGSPTLWKVSIDGGEAVQLTSYPTLGPSVSPDGKLVACAARLTTDSPITPVVIPIEGGPPIRTYEITGTSFSMNRWSPDGRGIIHNSGPSDRTNLWYQPLEGGPPRRITNFDDQYVLRFDVCADGRHLLIVRGVLSRDAVLITGFQGTE